MNSSRPVFKQLDHLIARVEEPRAVFSLLTETLGLPVAWPLASYPAFQSGGVALGNLYLEVLQCGPRRETARGHFCAIAFESPEIEEVARELSRRGIPHTPAVPYLEKGADGARTKFRSNVLLGKMLGDNFWLDLAVMLSRLPGATRLSDAGAGGAFDRWQLDKLFGGVSVFLVEFYYENFGALPFWSEHGSHGAKRAADRERLRACGGGRLGLESVKEIVAGVRDFEAARRLWRRFYAPAAETAPGVWRTEGGPAVRLVPARADSIRTLVLKVSSPRRAETFLRESGLLGAVADDGITIDPSKIEGLDVRLVG